VAATDPRRLRYPASVRVVGLGEPARAVVERIRPAAAAGIEWVVVDGAAAEGAAALGEGADILVLTPGDGAGQAPVAPLIGAHASRQGALVAGVVIGADAGVAAGRSGCLEDLRDAVDVLLVVADDGAFLGYLQALGGAP